MRIALVVPGGVGRGGEQHVIPRLLWFVERIARRHDVVVFALGQEPLGGSWQLFGARVHDVGRARGKLRRVLAAFGAEHRARPFDVIHAFFGWAGTHAALLGWRFRVPMLFHPSGGEFVAMPDVGYGMRCSALGRIGARLATGGARRVTVASEPMRTLARMHGVSSECVPLGVALDRWPIAAARARDRAAPARLLHVGDLRPVKDQAMLLDAAALLLDDGIDFTLDVVGLDTMHGALQRSAPARRLGARVRWHGSLGRVALRPLFDAADLLLVTSRHEAGPLVVLEAAIAGVPSVGTAVGHIAEWAPDAAVAVPTADAALLAREIAALLADDTRRLSLAACAQRRAITFDADYSAAAFERIYAELAATA